MSLRLSLVLALAVAGCAKQAPLVRAPAPMFDVSRICDDPHYHSVCDQTQAPVRFPSSAPIRIDTNLAAPPSAKLALQS